MILLKGYFEINDMILNLIFIEICEKRALYRTETFSTRMFISKQQYHIGLEVAIALILNKTLKKFSYICFVTSLIHLFYNCG